MTRYVPECVDGSLLLVSETGDDEVEIGTIDDVIAAMGGDTFALEYDEKQRTQPWLETDEGTLDIDVQEVVTELPLTPEQVDELREYGMGTERYGLPRRTFEYANTLTDILHQQGTQSNN